jgi:hypothetical protein
MTSTIEENNSVGSLLKPQLCGITLEATVEEGDPHSGLENVM